MTRTFKTTFTNAFNGKQEIIITKVTDRMEERGLPHKRAYAIEKAHRQFEKTHTRFVENEERGCTVMCWKDETVEL